jgi:hypothetical protein
MVGLIPNATKSRIVLVASRTFSKEEFCREPLDNRRTELDHCVTRKICTGSKAVSPAYLEVKT